MKQRLRKITHKGWLVVLMGDLETFGNHASKVVFLCLLNYFLYCSFLMFRHFLYFQEDVVC